MYFAMSPRSGLTAVVPVPRMWSPVKRDRLLRFNTQVWPVGVAGGVNQLQLDAPEVDHVTVINRLIDAGVLKGLVGRVGVISVDDNFRPRQLFEPLGAAEMVAVGVGEDDVPEARIAELLELVEPAVNGDVVPVARVDKCAFALGEEVGVGRVVSEEERSFLYRDVQGVKARG